MNTKLTDYQIQRQYKTTTLTQAAFSQLVLGNCLSQKHPDCEKVPAGPASRADRPQGLPSRTIFEVGCGKPGDKHYRKKRVFC